VIADPGYSLARTETYHLPLRKAGVKVLHKPTQRQRGLRPPVKGVVVCDDTVLHPATPANLLMQPSRTAGVQEPLSFAPPNSDEATRAAHEAPFNQRARWRMRLHHTDDNGTAWFVCPFCAGALSATGMKVYNGATPGPRATPVTGHMRGHGQCCNGLVRLTAEELGRWQDIPAGTTAHWYAYHARRQQVENANSALKATQTQLNSKHTLVFGLVKRQVLLGFTLAAYNQNVGAAFSTR
jgi:hypothetical protein